MTKTEAKAKVPQTAPWHRNHVSKDGTRPNRVRLLTMKEARGTPGPRRPCGIDESDIVFLGIKCCSKDCSDSSNGRFGDA